jgi:hypothetical protein
MSVASVSPDPGPKEVRPYWYHYHHITGKKRPKVVLKSHVMKKPYVLFLTNLIIANSAVSGTSTKNELFRPTMMQFIF